MSDIEQGLLGAGGGGVIRHSGGFVWLTCMCVPSRGIPNRNAALVAYSLLDELLAISLKIVIP